MTHQINAAISALELDKLEFAHLVAALQEEEYNELYIPEYEKQYILLKMSLLKKQMDFLERCIINGLLALDFEFSTLLSQTMKLINPKGTIARRNELAAKKAALEKQIPITADTAAAAKLRADYRAIVNELETYYNDIPNGAK